MNKIEKLLDKNKKDVIPIGYSTYIFNIFQILKEKEQLKINKL